MPFNDWPAGFTPSHEGPWMAYAPPPKVSVSSHADSVSRLAYEMKREAESAAIHVGRLTRLTEQGFAKEALQDRALSEAMEACSRALAEAIDRLTRKEAA